MYIVSPRATINKAVQKIKIKIIKEIKMVHQKTFTELKKVVKNRGTKTTKSIQKTKRKMANKNPDISMILNNAIKRQRSNKVLAGGDKDINKSYPKI